MKYLVPALLALSACVPRARPLTGVERPASALPRYALPPGPRQITFKWELEDEGMLIRGDGVTRVAPPDSARLDLFLSGGLGGGLATVIGDSLSIPPGPTPRNLIPPPPLLWATLGRLAIPPIADTIVRVSGDTLRAQFGHPAVWRMTAVKDQLVRLERLDGGRIVEFVERTPGKHARYEFSGRRSLVLDVQREQSVPPFDASIWHIP